MNNRLQQFLSAENISQAQFADSIEVARASVSHVLAGRNKPGYDFIKSISDHYPKLNLDWLINGKGKMYKDVLPIGYSDALFGPEEPEETPAPAQPEPKNEPLVQSIPVAEKPQSPAPQRTISRITIFYSDGSFQDLT